MSRLAALYQRVDAALDVVEDEAWRRKFTVHLHGVAECAALLARKRGLDAELAIVAGMLHDISAAGAGNYDDHCRLSAEMARGVLSEIGAFSFDEIEAVRLAIDHHDYRDRMDTPFDEVLKDADILHPYLHSLSWPLHEPTKARLQAMVDELGM